MVYFVPKHSEEKNNDSFGRVELYGKGIERHIIAEVVMWSGNITRKIFADKFLF